MVFSSTFFRLVFMAIYFLMPFPGRSMVILLGSFYLLCRVADGCRYQYGANEAWNCAGAIKQATGRRLWSIMQNKARGPFLPMHRWVTDNSLPKTTIGQVV